MNEPVQPGAGPAPASDDAPAQGGRLRAWHLLPLAAFAALAWFLLRGLSLDPREIPSPLIGKPAPDFRLTALDDPNRTVSRADMLGKVWLLNAWASWCVECRYEHPVLVEFARSSGVAVVGLDYKETARADGLRWLGQLGNPYAAVAYDDTGRTGIDFGVYAVPETFLIDKQGVIRYKRIGAVTPELLRDQILPLIKTLEQG